MRIDIATLFPEMCEAFLGESIIGRARKAGFIDIGYRHIREYTLDKHNRVDDSPYGGGKGMLLQAEPIYRCYEAVKEEVGEEPYVVYMSPRGKILDQKDVCRLSEKKNLLIICGHYEGVDERLLEEIVDEEISIGDYVISGGEMAAMVLADSVARLCKGVLADDECFEQESHYNGLLEYPQYTRPAVWRGREVPEELVSGHHANIEKWRREKSLKLTFERRPDLLEKAELSEADRKYIEKLRSEQEK